MNKKGFVQVLVIGAVIVALILLGVAIYMFVTRGRITNPTGYSIPSSYAPSSETPVPTVKSAADLNVVAKDLDQTNLDSIDSSLNQNTADANSF